MAETAERLKTRVSQRKGFRNFEEVDGVVDLTAIRRAKRRKDARAMKALREKLIARAVRELNRKHAYIERGNDVLIVTLSTDHDGRTDLKFRTRAALVDLYDFRRLKLPKVSEAEGRVSWEYVNPVAIWSRHPKRRNLKGIANSPGRDLGPEWLNVWNGWGVAPLLIDGKPDFSGEGCVGILSHILEVWCGGSDVVFRWVLAWLASIVQQPTAKPDTGLMVYGEQGSGKSIIIETVMAPILGTAYGYESSNAFLTARFNNAVAGKLLIYADEAVFAGDREAADRLKAFVSKKTVTIEQKGRDSFDLDHHARVFATTNRGHAILMEKKDRRWLTLETADHRRGDRAYFTALAAEINNGGIAAFHAYLLNPDLLDGIDLRTTPQKTASVAQKVQSLESAEAFIYECLRSRTVQIAFGDDHRAEWTEEGVAVGQADLHKAYLEFCKAQAHRYPASPVQFSSKIREIMPTAGVGRTGSKPRYWKLPAIAVARGAFERWMQVPDDIAAVAVLWDDGEGGAHPDGCSEAADLPRVLPVTVATASDEADDIPF